MNKTFKKWIRISKIVAGVQATIILTILYFLFVIPMGIFLQRFFKNALKGHGYNYRQSTYWIKRGKVNYTLEWAREQ